MRGLANSAGGVAQATQHAYAQLYQQVQRQAALLSYVDIIRTFAMLTLVLVPLVLLFLKKNRPGEGPMGAH